MDSPSETVSECFDGKIGRGLDPFPTQKHGPSIGNCFKQKPGMLNSSNDIKHILDYTGTRGGTQKFPDKLNPSFSGKPSTDNLCCTSNVMGRANGIKQVYAVYVSCSGTGLEDPHVASRHAIETGVSEQRRCAAHG
jgi:hypothetical protein